jgi:hypothetical protein
MTPDIHALCVLAEGFSGHALSSAVADALVTQFPVAEEREGMARLVAAWLRNPEGDPPPLPANALEAIYRQLARRTN